MHNTCSLLGALLLSALLAACGGGGGGGVGGGVTQNTLLASVTLSPAAPPTHPHVADEEYNANPYLKNIKAAAAYRRGYFGQGVTIGIADSGMLTSHVDLRANVVPGFNFADTVTIIYDGVGHGTAVGAVAAAAMDGAGMHGVAPSARLMPLQLADEDDHPSGNERDAYRYAASMNVPIVNNSFGVPFHTVLRYETPSMTVTGMIRGAALSPPLIAAGITAGLGRTDFASYFAGINEVLAGQDIVLVWAAGNGGWNSVRGGMEFTSLDYATTLTISPASLTVHGTVLDVELEKGLLPASVTWNEYRLNTLGLRENHPTMESVAPLYERGLFGKWVAVVATDTDDTITDFSNGCGAAMHWCIAAPGMSVRIANGMSSVSVTVQAGSVHISVNARNDVYGNEDGTSFAAPHVSGALAVLKSRFRTMPMNAILAIMLKTATDLGDEGVDEVYGHGLLNLEAAITVQGEINLVIDDSAVGSLAGGASAAAAQAQGVSRRLVAGQKIRWAPGFEGMARRLAAMPVAVGYLDGRYYYDAPLGELVEFSTAADGADGAAAAGAAALGNAAADMFGASWAVTSAAGKVAMAAAVDARTGRLQRAGFAGGQWRLDYALCAECDLAAWRIGAQQEDIGNAYFGAGEQSVGVVWTPLSSFASRQDRQDNLEVFSALGLGEDGARETHRQYGVRWRENMGADLSLLVEVSEIRERETLLGNDSGGLLGALPAKSRQARLQLGGNLPLGLLGGGGAWQWQGGYTQGWAESGADGNGLVADISGLRYAHWHGEIRAASLLRGGDEFRLGVAALPRVTGRVELAYYRAAESTFVEDFQFALPQGVEAHRLTVRRLSDSALVWRLGYKWRVTDDMDAALGWELLSNGGSGGGNGSDHAASFQLRWRF